MTRRRGRVRRRLGVVAVAGLALVGACVDGDDAEDQVVGPGDASTTTDDTTARSSTTSPSTTSSGPTTTSFAGRSSPTSAPPPPSSTEVALLDDVRVEVADGVERVVFELVDDQLPGYEVRPLERPVREAGSGEEVSVEGDAVLGIRLEPASGVNTRDASFEPTYEGPARVEGRGGTVTEVVRTGDFEANLEWAIGLRGDVPFRVVVTEEPPAVTVEVPAR